MFDVPKDSKCAPYPLEQAGQFTHELCYVVKFLLQILKLQESPDSVPHGEMPRHMQLYVDRSLVDRVVPGNRVTVLGIYSIKKSFAAKKAGASGKSDNVGVRAPYMRVIGIEVSSNQMF